MRLFKRNFDKIGPLLSFHNFNLDPSSELSYYLKFGFPDTEYIDIELVKKIKKKIGPVFKVGKYKGINFDTVFIKDPQYINWVKRQDDWEKNFLIKQPQQKIEELTTPIENIISFELK